MGTNSSWLLSFGVMLAAGLVRGFAGFGAAMIIMPGLSLIYRPVDALAILTVIDLPATLQLLPAAIRQAQWRQVLLLSSGAAVAIPLGLWIMVSVDRDIMRRVIAAMVLLYVTVLALGWRYRTTPGSLLILGVGAVSGFLGGSTGMGGPPVIVFLMSGSHQASVIRGSILAYFAVTTVIYLGLFGWRYDLLTPQMWWHALVLTPVYVGATWLGSRLFRQASEPIYRWVTLVFLACLAIVVLFY
ncbi:MAG: hypothetical protein ETSY1_07450 [Candidatus Entotheonella factor]|uniref:Probable membrane transporter protein n=1 Tax=Entotheonella factor TaxID=1429438 RepID=W4LVM8_ENTF1|nr:sulfite exporter TauE/SafE family protein [Candidatus Entotheonella palauensis]ETX01427.1 MAG: hypothetical protein ETSY1_07450 [Candidatus Entotheonella factor]